MKAISVISVYPLGSLVPVKAGTEVEVTGVAHSGTLPNGSYTNGAFVSCEAPMYLRSDGEEICFSLPVFQFAFEITSSRGSIREHGV